MLARGASPYLFAPLVGMALFAALVLVAENMRVALGTIPFFVLFVVFLWFFRDPERVVGPGIVSPADGRVLSVDGSRRRVAVFLGLFDVHVNRAPIAGWVASMEHTGGGHAVASSPAAAGNERLETVIETPLGDVVLVQVAGYFARRIVPYVRQGDTVRRGQRIGLIRFGSRVELSVPPTMRIVVRAGDRVRAGETKIAEMVSDAVP